MTKKDQKLEPSRVGRHDVQVFLKKLAVTNLVSENAKGRLLFALDATASRQPTWNQACLIQSDMFAAAASLGGIAMQIAYYRGYGEFYALPWSTQSEHLIKRMSKVSCLGGFTQINRLLDHAILETKQNKINALVFVGDCVEEDIDLLSEKAGRLGLLGVPVFIFQEGNNQIASLAFSHIAELTKGAHCMFNESSADQLRSLLKAVAIFAVGGKKALQEFSKLSGSEVKLLASKIK